MLDLGFVRNNLDIVKKKVLDKGVSFDVEHFTEKDNERRRLIAQVEQLKGEKKKLAKETGILSPKKMDTKELEEESIRKSRHIGQLEGLLKKAEEDFRELLLNIPNIFDDSVPVGKNESDNVVVREWGKKPEFKFTPKPHWELGELGGGLDFARAAKISGSRFALYFGSMAKLERVLIQMMLDIQTTRNGYMEVLPPFLVNDKSLIGTGNLPKFEDDLFKIKDHNLYLIPTAEVPLTNIYRDEVLDGKQLPLKYVAFTPCFRSEAGSYGKDVRGIIRQHQFNKVELLKFVRPESSYLELEALTKDAESILQELDLHYRVVKLCSGDLSFSSAKTYDIEVWMPARKGYVEISSCSNFLDFQARRSMIKYKTDDGKKDFLHTLNGSGLAVGRTVAAIMENYQEEDGKMSIPAALMKYFPQQETF